MCDRDCMYNSKYTTDVRRHIESKHFRGIHSCAVCQYVASTFVEYKHHYGQYHSAEYKVAWIRDDSSPAAIMINLMHWYH